MPYAEEDIRKGSLHMNRIGIIGAMDEEVKILKELMPDARVNRIASMDFYEGTLEGRQTVVVRSGIGKVPFAPRSLWIFIRWMRSLIPVLPAPCEMKLTSPILSFQPIPCSMIWMPGALAMRLV
jgi:hypothetical protein